MIWKNNWYFLDAKMIDFQNEVTEANEIKETKIVKPEEIEKVEDKEEIGETKVDNQINQQQHVNKILF